MHFDNIWFGMIIDIYGSIAVISLIKRNVDFTIARKGTKVVSNWNEDLSYTVIYIYKFKIIGANGNTGEIKLPGNPSASTCKSFSHYRKSFSPYK